MKHPFHLWRSLNAKLHALHGLPLGRAFGADQEASCAKDEPSRVRLQTAAVRHGKARKQTSMAERTETNRRNVLREGQGTSRRFRCVWPVVFEARGKNFKRWSPGYRCFSAPRYKQSIGDVALRHEDKALCSGHWTFCAGRPKTSPRPGKLAGHVPHASGRPRTARDCHSKTHMTQPGAQGAETGLPWVLAASPTRAKSQLQGLKGLRRAEAPRLG